MENCVGFAGGLGVLVDSYGWAGWIFGGSGGSGGLLLLEGRAESMAGSEVASLDLALKAAGSAWGFTFLGSWFRSSGGSVWGGIERFPDAKRPVPRDSGGNSDPSDPAELSPHSGKGFCVLGSGGSAGSDGFWVPAEGPIPFGGDCGGLLVPSVVVCHMSGGWGVFGPEGIEAARDGSGWGSRVEEDSDGGIRIWLDASDFSHLGASPHGSGLGFLLSPVSDKGGLVSKKSKASDSSRAAEKEGRLMEDARMVPNWVEGVLDVLRRGSDSILAKWGERAHVADRDHLERADRLVSGRLFGSPIGMWVGPNPLFDTERKGGLKAVDGDVSILTDHGVALLFRNFRKDRRDPPVWVPMTFMVVRRPRIARAYGVENIHDPDFPLPSRLVRLLDELHRRFPEEDYNHDDISQTATKSEIEDFFKDQESRESEERRPLGESENHGPDPFSRLWESAMGHNWLD